MYYYEMVVTIEADEELYPDAMLNEIIHAGLKALPLLEGVRITDIDTQDDWED